MKKPLLLTIIILVAVGGFLLYNHFSSNKVLTAWDLVPVETVLVYENGNCASCVEDIRKAPITTLIKKAALLEIQDDSLRVFQEFATAFTEHTLVSLHVTRKDEFDFTYYIKKSENLLRKLNLVVDQALKRRTNKKTERVFNNITIHEVTSGKKVFSWIELDDVWVGSFSPVLIEDVIRTLQGSGNNFRRDLGSVYHMHSVKNDGGNLFVNLSRLDDWFGIFVKGNPSRLLEKFGTGALLDTKITGDQIVLNGFSARAEHSAFLSSFADQSPVPFALRHIISNRALMVASYGLSNGDAFFKRVHTGRSDRQKASLQESLKEVSGDPASLLQKFSGELAVCWLESAKESLMPVMIIHDREDISRWSDVFLKIAETKVADSLFVDQYSGYTIFELPEHAFVEHLFSPLVTEFTSGGYYVQAGDAICIASDIEELKRFLKDIDQENTWGKSVAQNKFFESTLLEANVSLFVNTPKALSMLEGSLHPKWKSFLDDNKDVIHSLGMGAIQFSHLNDNFYTNLSWSLKEYKPSDAPPKDRFMTIFDSRITSMSVVDSHVDRSKEILVQDSSQNLTLLSTDGKMLWKRALPGLIQGDVHQIDFLNNGKLQYFFCTPGKMHVVDRLGNYVKPYPVDIPENNISFVSLIDYNHNKQYRFLLASREGNLWIYDKEGNNLEGWQPRKVGGPLLAPPNHHRLLGRDYMLAIRKDGNAYLMNRRGELMPRFPLDLKARLDGDYYVDRGKTPAETTFTVMSVDGTKIKFNLQGKIVSREVMVKTALDAKFSLCAEREGKSYLVLRTEPSHFTVFDENSNEIIKSDFIGNRTETDFLLPGNGRHFIIITDKNQELSYVYDRSGKLLSTVPIESSRIELNPMENGRIKIFSSIGTAFRVSFLP